MSAEQRLQMYVVNGSDGRCLVAVRLIVGVRYLERPLREVLLYIIIIIITYNCIYNLLSPLCLPLNLWLYRGIVVIRPSIHYTCI